MMEQEENMVVKCLKNTFPSASDIFVDTTLKECEVKVSVDDYQGEIPGKISDNGIILEMVDFCDVFPYKYVFSYHTVRRTAK